MNWLRRTRRSGPEPAQADRPGAPGSSGPAAPGRPPPAPAVEGAAPGLAALLDGIADDGTRMVLDLGAASGPSLDVYARYARRIRFADMMGDGGWHASDDPREGLLRTIAAPLDHPCDLILAWDTLDRLLPEDRPRLVEWLAAGAAASARLHVLVRGTDATRQGPHRFAVLGTDRIRYEPVPGGHPPRGRILPAEVAKLLAPFRVAHAYTLKSGLREYVALR